MLSRWKSLLASAGCLGLVFCGGGSGEGGKSSDAPLVVALNASPSPAWLNAAVTFSATCVSATASPNLSFTWRFGDGRSDTTIAPTTGTTGATAATDVHNYTSQGSYAFSVTCTDPVSGTSATAPSQNITVSNYDLSVVATDVCSSGVQGFGWCWQNPLPTGSNLQAVAAVSPLTAWTVGYAGTVLETNDGGLHWLVKYPGIPTDLLAVEAADQNNAVVVARDGSVLATQDAGLHWSRKKQSVTQAFSGVSIVDSNTVWAINASGGNPEVVETTDGGSTWSSRNLNGADVGGAIAAVAGPTVWVVGGRGGGFAFKTTDGTNWMDYDYSNSIPGASTYLTSVSITPANSKSPCKQVPSQPSVWIGGAGTQLGSASKFVAAVGFEGVGGAQPQPTVNLSYPFPFGFGGLVLKAFDQDTAWGTEPGLHDPQTFQEYTGAISVTTGTINDASWSNNPLPTQVPPLNALASPDCLHGWAVGNGGSILATTDGATTWQPQSSSSGPGKSFLGSISAVSNSTAYTAASDVTLCGGICPLESAVYSVLSTHDGGVHWVVENTVAISNLLATIVNAQITASAAGYVLLAGTETLTTYSPLRHSWDPISDEYGCSNNPNLCNLVVSWVGVSFSPDSGSAWAVSQAGEVVEEDLPPPPCTSSFCSNWSQVGQLNATNGIIAFSNTAALVVGPNGFISSTTNKGNQWFASDSTTSNDLNAVSIATRGAAAGIGWAVGASGTILKTLDYGQHWVAWTQQNWVDTSLSFVAVSSYSFSSVATPDGVNVWVVGQPLPPSGGGPCASNCSAVIVHSGDSGKTWATQPTGAQSLSAVAAIDKNVGWLAGGNGSILKTMTGGAVQPN